MNQVPRHVFFPSEFLHFAYDDKAFPIGEGQTISQPYTVAFQTQLLAPEKGKRILEIGTGSGYQCAVLCQSEAEVYSMEYFSALHRKAQFLLSKLGLSPHLRCGDGNQGWPEAAPFDGIIVTAGSFGIPENLLAQLAIGGCLVIPAGEGDDKTMLRITRKDQSRFEQESFGAFKFVPLLNEK